MEKINDLTGLSVSVYHNFSEEVKYYKQHIWRCNGRCSKNPPFFGLVRRAMNRKPQKADSWFAYHQMTCGGEFIKIGSPSDERNSPTPKNRSVPVQSRRVSNKNKRNSLEKK